MLEDALNIEDMKTGRMANDGRRQAESDEMKAVVRSFLGNPYGRRFFYQFIREMGYDTSTFNINHAVSSYLEGQRASALRLVSLLKDVSVSHVYQMLSEGENHE